MNFNEWLLKTGFSKCSLAALSGVCRTSIYDISNGKVPTLVTVKKLVDATKTLYIPLSYEMFPFVYLRGHYKRIPIKEALKK